MTTKQTNAVAITVLVIALAMVWLAPTTVPVLLACVAPLLVRSQQKDEAAAAQTTTRRTH